MFKAGKANALVEQMIEGAKEEDEDRKIDFFDLSALYPANAGAFLHTVLIFFSQKYESRSTAYF